MLMVHMHMVDMDVDHLGFLPTKNWEITQHKSGGVRTSCKLWQLRRTQWHWEQKADKSWEKYWEGSEALTCQVPSRIRVTLFQVKVFTHSCKSPWLWWTHCPIVPWGIDRPWVFECVTKDFSYTYMTCVTMAKQFCKYWTHPWIKQTWNIQFLAPSGALVVIMVY